jgi:hypothetical protein
MTAKYAFYNVDYLNDADVGIWASMAYWRAEEALFLSLNICPEKDGEENDESDALEIGRDYKIRQKMANRAITRGELECIETPCYSECPNQEDKEVSYVPKVFVKWALENFPSFPEKLYRVVKERHRADFSGFNPPREPKRELESKEKVVVAGAEPKSLIDRRWTPKREMEAKAIQFALHELERGCNCSHAELAEFMNRDACDIDGRLIFNHAKINEKSMSNLLMKAARNAFQEKAPNRIVGNTGYSKAERHCPIHPK